MTAPIVLNEQGNNDHFYKNSERTVTPQFHRPKKTNQISPP